jgi:hypothetical protein
MIQIHKAKFNTSEYPFREIVKDILEEKSLENLHVVKKYAKIKDEYHDQDTIWHKKYYDKFQWEFYPLYEKFIREVVMEHFNWSDTTYLGTSRNWKNLIYQKIPTFRVHQVDNLGVGAWHKDSDYNHGVDEINCLLPFTDAYDTNTIWMESEVGKKDFKPYNINYGEFLVFSGANLMHGNQTNEELDTRCSIDFRVVHPKDFKTSNDESVSANVKFKIGGYFEQL